MKLNTKFGLWIGIIGTVTTVVLLILNIQRSTVSTAVIGYVFLPFYFLFAFIIFFVVGYSISYLKNWWGAIPRVFNLGIILVSFFGVIVPILLVVFLVKGIILTTLVSQIQQVNSGQELILVFETSTFKNNKFVLGAITQNPKAPAELLDRIARLDDPQLHEAMGSLFPLMGDNTKGLAVMRLVVKSKNVSPDTIEYLADTSQVDYVLGDIAGNLKTSVETLRRLVAKKNYLIDWGLAQNKNTPADVFAQILIREKDFTQKTTLEMLVRNPSTSPEVRNKASELLQRY